MTKRNFLLSLLLTVWGAATAWALVPENGKTYYIYCDNDTPQYFYVNGNNRLAIANKPVSMSKAYLWQCTTTTDDNGNTYYQFRNQNGKYLAHKGVSNTAYNFQVNREKNGTTSFNANCVNLYSVDAGKYFVMKNDNSFDQADGLYNKTNSDFSTDYMFVEYEFPKAGETYYIYADTYKDGQPAPRYLMDNNNTLTASTTFDYSNRNYQWTAEAGTDGKWYFRNASGKYLAHKSLADAGYNFDVHRIASDNNLATELWSVKDARYMVVSGTSGSFNQSTVTYHQAEQEWCSDYVFIPTDKSLRSVSVSAPAGPSVTVTFDGQTSSLPASFFDMLDVTSDLSETSQLTINYTNDGTWTYRGLYNGNTQVAAPGESYTITNRGVNILNLTASFSPDIFSKAYGEKWVRLQWSSNNAYFLRYDGSLTKTYTGDYDEGTLWCLVGDASSFKLYNRAVGNSQALKAASNTPGNGTTVSFTAAASATEWQLTDYLNHAQPGYGICVKGQTGQSLNSYAGAGNEVKFYGAGDGGSHWMPVRVDDVPFTFSLRLNGTATSTLNTKIGKLTVTSDGLTGSTTLSTSIAAKKFYPNTGKSFTISTDLYRGYRFEGFDVNGTVQQTLTDFRGSAGGTNVVATVSADLETEAKYLAYSPSATGKPYRIPSIVKAKNGNLIAFYDHRPCGSDIGYGEVDVMYRISEDNGRTWTDEAILADGVGEPKAWNTGFGDAASVADVDRNEVVIFMVCGKTVCWNGNYQPNEENYGDPNRVARVRGTYNEATGKWEFTAPVEVTDDIYSKFVDTDGNATVTSLFIGSGRICQSRQVKKGDYYRLYCSVWTKNGGNRVIYSDDFGETWNVLGTIADRPAPQGDEPKCEELPDGRVLLSSRKGNGRFFNIFTFADATMTTGSWGEVKPSNEVTNGLSFGKNSTNGEILLCPGLYSTSTGEQRDVLLQSIPTGDGRSNVAIYYKPLDNGTAYTTESICQGWTKGIEVSPRGSAYSTMVMQADNRLAFFMEEEPNGYCMVYMPLDIEQATGDAFSATAVRAATTLLEEANNVLNCKGVGYPSATSTVRTHLAALAAQPAAKISTAEQFAAIRTAITNMKEEKNDIEMPTDGKAYRFVSVLKNGTRNYFVQEGTNKLSFSSDPAQATTYVARKAAEGKFFFVNNSGKYLTWRHNTEKENNVYVGYNRNMGYADAYTTESKEACDLSILKLDATAKNVSPDNGQADLFGFVYIQGKRYSKNEPGTFVQNNSRFDGANVPFFNDSWSSAYLLEEVSYPNTVTLNAISASDTQVSGLAAGTTLATFSAPFPVVVPENVTAYYAKENTNGATLEPVTEPALPANQGFILASATGLTQATFVPAAAETQHAFANGENLLGHSAGANKTMAAGDYILTRGNVGIAFYPAREGSNLPMNRAYLPLGTNAAEHFMLDFGGNATGLQLLPNDGFDATQPAFYLDGRRALEPRRGELIIQNGQKRIVK